MIKRLQAKLEAYIHPPLEDVIANNVKAAELEIMQCDHTIRLQSFVKHMAIARQNAMLEWVESEQEKRGQIATSLNVSNRG